MVFTGEYLKARHRNLWIRVICSRITDLLHKVYGEPVGTDVPVQFTLPCGMKTGNVNIVIDKLIDHAFDESTSSTMQTQYEALIRVMAVCALVTAEVAESK